MKEILAYIKEHHGRSLAFLVIFLLFGGMIIAAVMSGKMHVQETPNRPVECSRTLC